MFRASASIFLILLLITLGGCDQTPTSKAHVRVEVLLKKRSYRDAVQLVERGLEKNPGSRERLEERLILLLASGNRSERGHLLEVQKKLDAAGEGRQLLEDQANSLQPGVRQQVAWVFGMLKDESAAGTLRDLAEDQDSDVRCEAIRSLSRLRLSASRSLFLIRLRDANWKVRAESAEALEALGDKSVARQLFRSANDSDDYARSQVHGAIVALADPAQKELYLENLQSKRIGNRTAALLALLALRQPEAPAGLLELLQDPRTPDRQKIAAALSRSDIPTLADPFEKLLRQEKDGPVKRALLDYFSRRNDEQSERVLKRVR